jgi:RimJ/RimL family protein N-acetyltransferase
MAAFTAKDPSDKAAFLSKWERVLSDSSLVKKTILYGGLVAGHVVCHNWFGDPEVGYWIGKPFWGKGVASQALAELLRLVPTRPLYARVASDNLASIRVLEKCGFEKIGVEKGFANARGQEIDEWVLILKSV